MKKILRNLLWGGVVLSSLLVASCAKEYDDTELRDKITALTDRVSQLEQTVSTLNQQTIPGIQTIIDGMKANISVTDIKANADGSYSISFSNGKVVVVANGDGSAPTVGAKEVDGVYYWTINGELVKDAAGKPIAVSTAAPMFRSNNGGLEYSVDGGKTWVPVEMAPGSQPAISFTETATSVIFTFADGSSFELAKDVPFTLNFDIPANFCVLVGDTEEIPYSISGAAEGDAIEVGILTATPGFEAEVIPAQGKNNEGVIALTNVSAGDNATYKVYVFAANGKGKTDIKGLSFDAATLQAVLSVQMVPAAGGDITLSIKANDDYTVKVENNWVTVTPPTRARYNDNLAVNVDANPSNEYRSCGISLVSKASGEELNAIDLLQAPVATEATSLGSLDVLPDGTIVTVYGVSTIAASAAKAIITDDGSDCIYAVASGLKAGAVYDMVGVKKTDKRDCTYMEVSSATEKAGAEPVEFDEHASYCYYGAASYYNYFFSVNNGTLTKSGNNYFITGYVEPQQMVIYGGSATIDLDALVGKFVAVKGWVIAADTSNGKEDIEIIPTSVTEVKFAEEAGWSVYYIENGSDEEDYPELVGATVTNPSEDSFYTFYVGDESDLEKAGSVAKFIQSCCYEASDDLLYSLYYYGMWGYPYDVVFNALAYTESYETSFQKFSYGKHYIFAVGLDADGALTGKYAMKEIEKVSPYKFNTYEDYLGTYIFTNDEGAEEVWTFTEKEAGQSYYVSGIAGIEEEMLGTGEVAVATFNANSGMVSFSNQELGAWQYDGESVVDKFVAVWYGSTYYSNESYMDDPLIMSFANNSTGGVDMIIESDSYGPLEGFGYLCTYPDGGSLVGRYAAVSFDGAEMIKGAALAVPEYEDYLGEWSLGSSVWTIAEKEAGSTYSITGMNGQSGFPAVEAKYENGKFKVAETYLGEDEDGFSMFLSGEFAYNGSYYIAYPFNSEEPNPLFTGSLKSDGTITLSSGKCDYGSFDYYTFFGYLDDDNYYFGAEIDLPNTLKPYVYIPDTNVYLYKENFDGGTASWGNTWTFFDADGDGFNWRSGADLMGANLGRNGSADMLISQSYDNESSSALNPDNWAFSPAIQLAAANNFVSCWMCAQDAAWAAEHFAIYVSEGASTENATKLYEGTMTAAPRPAGISPRAQGNWYFFAFEIPADFNGKSVNVGFRHFNCSDWFILNLDDVAVTEGAPVAASAPAAAPKASAAKAIAFKGNQSLRINAKAPKLPLSESRPEAPSKAPKKDGKITIIKR